MNNNDKSRKGVIALAVVTACVLGSLISSFRNSRTYVTPVSQLLEQAGGESGLSLGDVKTEKNEVLTKPAETSGEVRGPLDVSDVVAATMPCIVSITSESVQVVESYFYGRREIPRESAGSGIIIGQSDEELLIATNYHVIDGSDTITVCFSVDTEDADEAIVEALLKGSDETKDLAVVAVKNASIPEQVRSQIRIAALGDSGQLVVGQRAIAIGNALGYGQSVTAGIVSAVNRELNISGTAQNFIQTDAAINFGNSGGALLNNAGEVIGINAAKTASEGAEGMGYAIPINEAKPILEELMNKVSREKVAASERGGLGVSVQDVSEEARMVYDIPAGAFVYGVEDASAAEKAGISRGDIITELDGNKISSAASLEKVLNYYKAGERVTVVFYSGSGGAYREKEVSLKLGESGQQDRQGGSRYASPYEEPGMDPWSDFFGFW